jgi:hypothetical protein
MAVPGPGLIRIIHVAEELAEDQPGQGAAGLGHCTGTNRGSQTSQRRVRAPGFAQGLGTCHMESKHHVPASVRITFLRLLAQEAMRLGHRCHV